MRAFRNFRVEMDEVEQLPHPQRNAVEIALGRIDGTLPIDFWWDSGCSASCHF